MKDNVVFRNKGLIDVRGITTFGVCAKEKANPIGHFGTGLKYAIAVCLRHGHKVTLWRGKQKYQFTTKPVEMRGTEFNWVYMNDQEMPFTTELGKEWPLWCAYREFYCNTTDEPTPLIAGDVDGYAQLGHTTFVVEGEAFRALHEERDSVILTTKPLYKLPNLEIHEGTSVGRWLYYKGVRVYKLDKPAMYNYNLTGDLKLTEDRTLANWYDIHQAISYGVAHSVHMGLIKRILEANEKYFEAEIDFTWCFSEPGKVFNKTIERYVSSGYSAGNAYNSSAKRYHDKHAPLVARKPIILGRTVTTPEEAMWFRRATEFCYMHIPTLREIPIHMCKENPRHSIMNCYAYDDEYYVTDVVIKQGIRHIAHKIIECHMSQLAEQFPKKMVLDFAIEHLIAAYEQLGG